MLNPNSVLRRPAVEAKVGLSKSAIYAMMARGDFPRPIRLTAKSVGWRSEDVERWLASREVTA